MSPFDAPTSDQADAFPSEGAWRRLESSEDDSVNFLRNLGGGRMIETRFVRRDPDYIVCYLSSHLGCNQSCRFCHLTQSGQVDMTPIGIDGLVEQAAQVLHHFDRQRRPGDRTRKVNFNWMARGEPMLNPALLEQPERLIDGLSRMAQAVGLSARFNVSTIMPEEAETFDMTRWARLPITIYYSLYSLDPAFRKRWLPKAMDPHAALDRLKAYQDAGGRDLVLHWALIRGENDRIASIRKLAAEIAARGLRGRFNLVRYNPYSTKHGLESGPPARARTLAAMAAAFPEQGDAVAREIARVGFDVKASCGMFVSEAT